MSAFSLIIRMLSLVACGVAIFFWIDKQKVIAQKEAIIQETEHLVGYPVTERKQSDQVTLPASLRKEHIADLREERPEDISFQRMEELSSRLERIQKSDKRLGHNVRTIGGYDPNKHLTLRSHIEAQTQEIERLLNVENSLNARNAKLENELATGKTLLGEEIVKVDQLKITIKDHEAALEELENKHEELKVTYVQMIENTEIRIQQIIKDFKARQTGLVTKNNQLQALADERHRKLLIIEQEKRDMFRIIKELREQVAQLQKRTRR